MTNDDEFFDDALDEDFEFGDEDFDEVDLDSDFEDFDDTFNENDDSGFEEESSVEDAFQPKKKSFFTFDRIVILGAVIVGAFVMLGQIKPKTDEKTENQPKQFSSALKMGGALDGPGAVSKEEDILVKDSVEKEKSVQKGFLLDASESEDLKEVIREAPPMPATISANDTEIEVIVNDDPSEIETLEPIDALVIEDATSTEEIKEMPRAPIEGEISETFALKEISAPQIVAEEPAVIENPVKTVEPPVIQDAILEDVLPDEVADQEVVAVVVEQPAFVAQKPANDFEASSLDIKLDKIITRLDEVETKINRYQAVNDENLASMKREIQEIQSRTITIKPKEQAIDSRAIKTAKPYTSKKKKVTKKSAAIKWELRAAQPGKAWISRKGQKTAMQPIVVGDRLEGLGRIQDIAYKNGKWVVTGSLSTVRQ